MSRDKPPATPEIAEMRRVQERDKKRRQRSAAKDAQIQATIRAAIGEGDDDAADPNSTQLAPAGLITPPPERTESHAPDPAQTEPQTPAPEPPDDRSPPFSGVLDTEQARWVYERRKLTELEHQRRRGELIEIAEAQRQNTDLCRRIKAALDRAPGNLPASLNAEDRRRCQAAIAAAVKQALAAL
jgi:hypothetical protein